ncbi:hypothetical protein KY290_034343 [Solanum tuberosum]|uniref:DUF4218 domain-containing protein n=1 Tax=Solanum tuberosum TaxID=4113 RepID=A0ABQ7U3B0_SOLTU|nr:hypothetical protein KY284_033444 [Solanum tuberosum]KAH0741300.1 hypothetical protein KY290_034343 [Solanum tuberosum]
MERLERDIPQILCKLERIFPPGFFDSMEHLLVHLPYEAKIVGPVQYRWMYPFERYLGTLKRMIGNKASVEGSICEAYLMTESTQLFSHYFEPHVITRNHNVDRNDDGGDKEDIEGNLSIFSHPGRLWGEAKKRDLSLEEIKVAQTYILLNCEEVEPFVRRIPNLSQGQIDENLEANFSIWFKEFVQCNPIENEFLRSLARETLIDATSTQVCYVPYPSKKKDKDDWAAVLKVKSRNVIELPNEEVATISEVNVLFQVEEVEVHEIDMVVSIVENILLNDPNGDVIEMDEPIDDGLLQENHEIHIESTEEEYETEENKDEKEEEFEEDSMARGRGRGKSSGRSNPAIRSNSTGHTSIVDECESNSRHTKTLVFLTSAGLEPSQIFSSFIFKSFKSDVDPNGINRKGVSTDVRNGYFGEFKAIEKGRDPTPIELHLHVHTHGHDEKSFVGERSRIVHYNSGDVLRLFDAILVLF